MVALISVQVKKGENHLLSSHLQGKSHFVSADPSLYEK